MASPPTIHDVARQARVPCVVHLDHATRADLVREAVDLGVQSVMVVAHDPGMTVLAGNLSGHEISHMPTCAVATFTWDTDDWDVATAIDPTTDAAPSGEAIIRARRAGLGG